MGCEEQHMQIHRDIVTYTRIIAHLLREYLNMTDSEMEKYLASSCMECNGTRGTDVEIMCISHLLSICVYYHIPTASCEAGRWNRINPCIDSMITESNLCEMGIYLNHPTNHFELFILIASLQSSVTESLSVQQ